MWQKIKDLILKNSAKQVYAIIAGAIGAIWTVQNVFAHYEQFSSFGVAVVLIVGAVIAWWLFDKFILVGFDTIEELKKGNIAVGLTVLAFSILVGFALLASFCVFK